MDQLLLNLFTHPRVKSLVEFKDTRKPEEPRAPRPSMRLDPNAAQALNMSVHSCRPCRSWPQLICPKQHQLCACRDVAVAALPLRGRGATGLGHVDFFKHISIPSSFFPHLQIRHTFILGLAFASNRRDRYTLLYSSAYQLLIMSWSLELSSCACALSCSMWALWFRL